MPVRYAMERNKMLRTMSGVYIEIGKDLNLKLVSDFFNADSMER